MTEASPELDEHPGSAGFISRYVGAPKVRVQRWLLLLIGLLVVAAPLSWWRGTPPPPMAQSAGVVVWLGLVLLVAWQGGRHFWLVPERQIALLFLTFPICHELIMRTGGSDSPLLVVFPALAVGSALMLRPRAIWWGAGGAVGLLVAVWVVSGNWSPASLMRVAVMAGIAQALPAAVWLRLQSLRRRANQAVAVLEQWEQRSRLFDPSHGTTELLLRGGQHDQPTLVQPRYRERAEQLLGLLRRAIPQAHSCVLFIYLPVEERLRLELCVGSSPGDYREELLLPVGRGMIGWAAKEGKPCIFSRLEGHRRQPDYYRSPVTVRSLLVYPFYAAERLEGVICVDSTRSDALGEREESLIALMAGCLHTQLEDLRQQQLIEQKSREFSLLLEASQLLNSRLDLQHRLETMTEQAQSIVKSNASMLCLVEGGERRAKIMVVRGEGFEKALGQNFALTDGVVSLIVKNRQPILLSQLAEEHQPTRFFPLRSKIHVAARSFLGLPLLLQDRVIGLLVCTADAPSAFTATHQHLLSILCNQAAQAIADAQLHAEVERLASIDGLTGIFNHRAFHDRLHYEWEQAQRHGESLTLMMIDLDYFKRINDTYGHQAGDHILKQVAGLLKRLTRTVDTVGRYGGEEFAVLLPKTSAHQASKMAERIRKMIERSQFGTEGVSIPVTLSVGVASAPGDATGPDHLVSVADKALYWAKAQGRNRIALYPELVSAMARSD